LCRDLAKDGIRFSIDVDEALTVWADSLQVRQVLFNLFLNAREAMAKSHSGRLTVSAARQEEQVIIEVRNTGEPIPPDLLPHIFDLFRTSKPVTRQGRRRCGGLGLALCRDLVEENNGTIGVTSGPDMATTFTIVLPATRREASATGVPTCVGTTAP
jgi:signal transduction histidine kinase